MMLVTLVLNMSVLLSPDGGVMIRWCRDDADVLMMRLEVVVLMMM